MLLRHNGSGSWQEVADDTIDGGAGFGLVDASADGEWLRL